MSRITRRDEADGTDGRARGCVWRGGSDGGVDDKMDSVRVEGVLFVFFGDALLGDKDVLTYEHGVVGEGGGGEVDAFDEGSRHDCFAGAEDTKD